jgi:hypothetical protein
LDVFPLMEAWGVGPPTGDSVLKDGCPMDADQWLAHSVALLDAAR